MLTDRLSPRERELFDLAAAEIASMGGKDIVFDTCSFYHGDEWGVMVGFLFKGEKCRTAIRVATASESKAISKALPKLVEWARERIELIPSHG